jgi:hypothetical protein
MNTNVSGYEKSNVWQMKEIYVVKKLHAVAG